MSEIIKSKTDEQYLEERRVATEKALADPATSELKRQQLTRDLVSAQRFADAVQASGLTCYLNADTLFSQMKGESGFEIVQDEDGNVHCSINGANCRPETMVHKFSDAHKTLFRESYSEMAKKVYKSKEDFQSDKEKSDFIAAQGYEAFRDLPPHPEQKASPDAMTAADWAKLSLKEKSDFIAKYHQAGMEAVLSRRPADNSGTKVYQPLPTRKHGVVIYPEPEKK